MRWQCIVDILLHGQAILEMVPFWLSNHCFYGTDLLCFLLELDFYCNDAKMNKILFLEIYPFFKVDAKFSFQNKYSFKGFKALTLKYLNCIVEVGVLFILCI